MPKVELLNIDCMEYMKSLDDNIFDLVLSDLPYGTTSCLWDSIIPLDEMWLELKRVTKENAPIVLTASQPFTAKLVMSNIKNFKCEWIWQKNRGSNFATAKHHPIKEHESVLVFCFGTARYFPIMQQRSDGGLNRSKYSFNPSNTGKREVIGGMEMKYANTINELRYPSSIQKFNCEVGLHPTQKPLALMEYLVKTYSQEGDLVFDMTMGSGTTGIAAIKHRRSFVGCELDKKYYDAACKRFDESTRQETLF